MVSFRNTILYKVALKYSKCHSNIIITVLFAGLVLNWELFLSESYYLKTPDNTIILYYIIIT